MTVATPGLEPREVLMRVRLAVPVVQVLLVVGVVCGLWFELTRASVNWPEVVGAIDVRLALEAEDEGLALGWSLWAPAIGGTLALALSAWTGWALLRLTWRSRVRWPNALAVLAEAVTWVLLAPLLAFVPIVLVVELLFVPI